MILTEKALVLGITGKGKTWFVSRHIISDYSKVIIFNTKGDPDYITENTIVIKDFLQLIDILENKDTFKISFFQFPPETWFPEVCECLFDLEGVLFVVEEMRSVDNPLSSNQSFRRLVLEFSRIKKHTLLLVGQRKVHVTLEYTSQCQEYILFAQEEVRDLEYFAKRYPKFKPYIETIMQLPVGVAFHILNGQVGIIDVREKITKDRSQIQSRNHSTTTENKYEVGV